MDYQQQEDSLSYSFNPVGQLGTQEPPALKWNAPFSVAVKHSDFYSH